MEHIREKTSDGSACILVFKVIFLGEHARTGRRAVSCGQRAKLGKAARHRGYEPLMTANVG